MTLIRQGFVSNSSSSSFIIFAKTQEDAKAVIEDMFKVPETIESNPIYACLLGSALKDVNDIFDSTDEESFESYIELYSDDKDLIQQKLKQKNIPEKECNVWSLSFETCSGYAIIDAIAYSCQDFIKELDKGVVVYYSY